jgi:hypothetical protein
MMAVEAAQVEMGGVAALAVLQAGVVTGAFLASFSLYPLQSIHQKIQKYL